MKIENIKFKAKRLDNGKWVEGYFYAECGNTYIIENRQEESMLNRNITYEVDTDTICQFTGLKDCKGKEIFEHDLIHFVGYEPTAEVIWSEDDYAFMTTSDMDLFLLSDVIDVGNGKIEVVGNKFDKESNYGKIQSR